VKFAILLSSLALTACAPTPEMYRLVDLSDEYVETYDRTRGASSAERVLEFQSKVVPLFPEFYGRDRYANISDQAYNDRIASSFVRFPAIRKNFEQTSNNIAASIDESLYRFTDLFFDMPPLGDIYLLHSLGEMDGGTREFGGNTYFILGLDVISQIHQPDRTQPFFHLELFHMYHLNWFNSFDQMWCALWSEGTAVLAAEELNPDADDDQLLLTRPQPIRVKVDANLVEAVCAIVAALDSTSIDDYDSLFGFQQLNERLPARYGNYVGFLVAKHTRRTNTLQQIAHMNNAEARAATEAGLASLATCPFSVDPL